MYISSINANPERKFTIELINVQQNLAYSTQESIRPYLSTRISVLSLLELPSCPSDSNFHILHSQIIQNKQINFFFIQKKKRKN